MILYILFILYLTGTFLICRTLIKEEEKKTFQDVLINEEELKNCQNKSERLIDEKITLEEESIKIFTLYEITKEITKTLNEEEAFEVFKSTLSQHVSFESCNLLHPLSQDIKLYKKDEDYFVFTLQGKRRKIGFLVIKGLKEDDKEKVMILGHQFALALRRVKLYEEIERIAITDSLTGFYTRRYTLERLDEEVNRSRMRKIKMSFLMIDVDHFKNFNDQYGHLTGDQILREIAKIIHESIREIDVAGRLGGEEFCVLLPDTDSEGAHYAAERIRQAAEKKMIKAYDATVQATVSIGVATFPKDGNSPSILMDRADWALYRAKKLGRNRVCAFGEDEHNNERKNQ